MPTKKDTTPMFKRKLGEHTLSISPRSVRVDLAEEFVCGGVEEHFHYECDITTRGLTPEGFVTEVKAFIDGVEAAFSPRVGMLQASCEQLAEGVAYVAHKMTKNMTECRVEVTNLTGSVVYIWTKGNKVPAFPKLAKVKAKKVRSQAAKPSVC